jgi:hypothetical protein
MSYQSGSRHHFRYTCIAAAISLDTVARQYLEECINDQGLPSMAALLLL